MILTRQHGLPFLHVLPTLIEDLLDIIGRSDDGIYYVVLHDVHETILDPGKSDHPLAAGGVVAQPPCNVAANLYLHTGLAEFDIAVVNPTFEKRGAKYLARGGQTMAVGGSCNGNELPKRAIIIVFDSLDKAKEWDSAEDVKTARAIDRGATFRSWIVEGVQP